MVVKFSNRREEKKPEITAESSLAPQFGSDTTTLVTGQVDMRRMSKINQVQVHCVAYFRRVPKHRGGRFWRELCEDILNLSVSEDGWNRNKMIQMVAGAQGSATQVGELVKKPGWIQRNVTKRDWKQKADEQGQQVVE